MGGGRGERTAYDSAGHPILQAQLPSLHHGPWRSDPRRSDPSHAALPSKQTPSDPAAENYANKGSSSVPGLQTQGYQPVFRAASGSAHLTSCVLPPWTDSMRQTGHWLWLFKPDSFSRRRPCGLVTNPTNLSVHLFQV